MGISNYLQFLMLIAFYGFWGFGQDVGTEQLISSGFHPTLLWP
jgi:hypothetical protein